ncbi:MAG: mannosyltransferase family protein [Caldilineales bacterium]
MTRDQGMRAWLHWPANRWVWVPALAFVVTRLGILAVAALSVALIPESTTPTPYHLRGQDNLLLDLLGSRWDTGFYVSIATEGYRSEGVPLPSVAFFPMLPLLMRLLGGLTGDVVPAGILISNAALLAAMMLLYRLVDREFGSATAGRSVWYMLIFPLSFFGSAIYTESLFLLFAIGAFYAARRGHWWAAALLGVCLTLTRLVGIIIAPVLLVEWFTQRRSGAPAKPRIWGATAAFLAPLGLLAYMVYLRQSFGDPLAFMHATAAWARIPQPIPQLVGELLAASGGPNVLNDWIDLLAVAAFVVLGIVLLAQERWSEGLFVALGALIPLSSGLLMSQRRYMWVLFPAFILLARWGHHPWVDRAITFAFVLGLAVFTALFAGWYWVA